MAYSDINGHWAEPYIRRVSEHGVMNGYSDGKFRPNSQVSRAELAKVISIGKWGDLYDWNYKEHYYKDYGISNHWAYKYICIATSNERMRGYPNGYFKPDNIITRAEVASVIGSSSNISANNNTYYKDVNINDWFYNNVLNLGPGKIMQGYSDGNFRPHHPITRGELAKIMSIYHYGF